ncbi:MAG: carbohydrate kinase family protein [Candidatus Asgardarchaeia archaeon]
MRVYAIGEVLIDFIAKEEKPLSEVTHFEKHAGGAPTNVLVALSRLGISTSLISKVGNDPFGKFLISKLSEEKVDTSNVVVDNEIHTGIVFVQLLGAKPEFILYKNIAYNFLKKEEINYKVIEDMCLLHFGSVMFIQDPSRSTMLDFLKAAKSKHITLSFDVNIRKDLWVGKLNEMLDLVEEGLNLANIVKISESELEYLLRAKGVPEDEFMELLGEYNIDLLAITRGEHGSRLIHKKQKNIVIFDFPALKVNPVDTTGAGDAFTAGLLAGVLAFGKIDKINEIKDNELEKIGKFANIVGALTTLKRGAWSSPHLDELTKFSEVKEIVDRLKNIKL